jgi:hypothetical protein
MRRFIDEQLTLAFGPDWPKRRMPPNLYDKWIDKKRKALEAGGPDLPLIYYADFTDYSPIICKDENWRVVFAVFFRRPENVRESFQRLHPIRLDTAHARLITQDDELLLYQAHTVRGFLSAAVGKKMGLQVHLTRREDGERVYSIEA